MTFLKTAAFLSAITVGPLLSTAAMASQGTGCMPLTGTVSGVQLSQNINSAIAALISSNSGGTTPATDCSGAPVAGQIWLKTLTPPYSLQIYDGAQWATIGTLDPTLHTWSIAGSGLAGPLSANGYKITSLASGTAIFSRTFRPELFRHLP